MCPGIVDGEGAEALLDIIKYYICIYIMRHLGSAVTTGLAPWKSLAVKEWELCWITLNSS